MKKLLLLFTVVLICACSKEDSNSPTVGEYSISGKFVTPNGTDAVAKASVKLIQNNTVIAETQTNSEGEFIINDLVADSYGLVISKGKFSTTKSIDLNTLEDTFSLELNTLPITDFPSIAVVTGSFDHIEEVLYNIGLVNPLTQEPLFDIIDGNNLAGRTSAHTHEHGGMTSNRVNNPLLESNVDFDFGDLIEDTSLLNSYDIIFLNCGLSSSKTEFSNNLTNYVENGGLLYATDWAYSYLMDITDNGNQYIDFYEPFKSGTSTSTEAEISPDISDWLNLNFDVDVSATVTIDEFLYSWQVVDSYDSETVLPWLYGPVEYDGISESKYLAYTFLHGNGGVLYSSFHTENNVQGASNVERLMQYMVFELADLNQE